MIAESGSVLRRSARNIVQKEGVRSRFFMKQVKTETDVMNSHTVKLEEETAEDGEPQKTVKTEIKEDVAIPPSPKRRRVEPITIEIKPEETEQEIPNNPAIPKNFYPIYEHIKAMRRKVIAPVDTMGCAEIPLTLNQDIDLSPKNYRFQLLISLMLSSQTKDEINFKAMFNMKSYFQQNGFEQGITLEAILWVDEKQLDTLIYSVGFHTRKASFIKRSAEILKSQWDGDIPNTVEGLVGLPGVGPKMAFLTLQKAWDLTLGIGVDTHLDRLAKMWRWVKNKKGPEQTRLELESWLPHELWNEINPELVGFGQSICLPRGRRCDLCSLSKTKLCSNVDRAQLKKVASMTPEEVHHMNRTLRFDPTPLMKDIEDLA